MNSTPKNLVQYQLLSTPPEKFSTTNFTASRYPTYDPCPVESKVQGSDEEALARWADDGGPCLDD